MPDARRQMWKNGVPKMLSSHHWKNISEQKQSNNTRKGTQKKNEKKNGLIWNEENKEGRPK